MSMRRNLLLSYLATQFKWLPYSYEYIYHSLVPSELPRFNIWDEEVDNNMFVNGTTGVKGQGNYIGTNNKVKVTPSTDYCILFPTASSSWLYLYEYDISGNYIGNKTLNFASYGIYTSSSNCYFIYFMKSKNDYGTTYNHDICINKSNSQLNGHYAPYSPRKVLDKSRILKISGNSEVRNQLLNIASNYSFTQNGLTITRYTDGRIAIKGTTANSNWTDALADCFNTINTHYYLCILNIKINSGSAQMGSSTYGFRFGDHFDYNAVMYSNAEIKRGNATTTGLLEDFMIKSNASGVYVDVEVRPNLIDLSQDFPFNTPTSITDPRVQNIIAQGYLPKNDGEIKNSVISEIESDGFNLFDVDYLSTLPNFSQNGDYMQANGSAWLSTNLASQIKVLPNTSYHIQAYLNCDSGITNVRVAVDYTDGTTDNGNFVQGGSSGISSLTSSSARTIKTIYITYGSGGETIVRTKDICINRSSSLNGIYKPHLPQQYLPSEYQEVEYLESHGTEYIDTGFKPNSQTSFDIKFIPKDNRNYVMGAWDSTTNAFLITLLNEVTYIRCGGEENFQFLQYVNGINVTHAELTKVTLNGITNTYANTSSTTRLTRSLLLFGRNNAGTIETLGGVTIYNCKLYDNNILVRNFIPCYRKTDNVAGLYDLVNNVFYTNAGTGTFAVGKKVNNNTIIKLPAPLELGGVNTAENTFEVTENGYVFTRNVFEVDTNNLTWTKTGGYAYIWQTSELSSVIKRPPNVNTLANIMADNYMPMAVDPIVDATPNTIGVHTDGKIYCNDSSSSNHPTGKLTYQLATPQTITIPKKHLGAVKLKDLSWTRVEDSGVYAFQAPNNVGAVAQTTGMFIEQYLSGTGNYQFIHNLPNKTVWIGATSINIRDDIYATATDFKNHFTDTDILFYETQNETTDFVNEEDVESGGEVNGNLFSWNKNQLVANGDFSDGTTGWYHTNGTKSIVNGKLRITPNNGATLSEIYQNNVGYTIGHYYLASVSYDSSVVLTRLRLDGLGSTTHYIDNTQKGTFTYIVQATNTSYFDIYCYNSPNGFSGSDYIDISNCFAVDLTIGFGAGNEPTDINDYRIQKIIELGYIPQDLVGTHTQVNCEVLPNVEMLLKCK